MQSGKRPLVSAAKCALKTFMKLKSEQNQSFQEKVSFSRTCRSGEVVEYGDAEPVV